MSFLECDDDDYDDDDVNNNNNNNNIQNLRTKIKSRYM